MIVLNSEQIMRVESEYGAQSFMDVLGDCYSNLSKTITVKQYITNVYDQFDDYL